jgi:putative RecB family exonuclease
MQLSVSRLRAYMQCPMLYRWRYELGLEPEFTSADLVFGSAIHHAIAEFHGSSNTLDGLAMMSCFTDYWDAASANTNGLRFKTPEEELIQKAAAMCEAYVDRFRDVAADETELLFQIPLIDPASGAGDPAHSLNGCIDMVANGAIYEFKTSGRAHSQRDADQSIQLTAYSLAYEYLYDQPPKALHLVTLTKTKEPKVHVVSTQRNPKDYQRLMEMAEGVLEAIHEGIYYRNLEPMYGCGGCAYQRTCLG